MARRVLIVDSDIGFILRLKKALEELGCEVRAMGRSRPALSALDEQRYDVAVVDLHLEHGDVADLILAMRVRQPSLPIVVSGSTPSDPDKIPNLDVQGYAHKPYVARDLMQLMERAIAQGYDFYAKMRAESRQPSVSENPERLENLAAAALSQGLEAEPPLDEGATVGTVLSLLQDPAVAAEILREHWPDESRQSLPPDTMPESNVSNARYERRTAEIEAFGEAGDITGYMAAAALRITSEDSTPLDTLILRIQQLAQQTGQPQIRPLPSWLRQRTTEERAYLGQLMLAIRPSPSIEELLEKTGNRSQLLAAELPSKEYDTTPYLAVTQPVTLPEIDLLPDPLTREEIEWLEGPRQDSGPINVELLEALAEAENASDPRLNAALRNVVESPSEIRAESIQTELEYEDINQDADLVATSVEELTQAMGVVLPEGIAEASNDHTMRTAIEVEPETIRATELSPADEAAVDEMLGEMDVIARAALQLTQLSLDNSALGILLTHNDYPVGRTGQADLPVEIWHEILQTVLMMWHREGQNNTRMRYIHLEGYGQCLIFSVRTIDDLTLTLILSGDLPVRIIRQQAAQLTEALMLVPEKSAEPQITPEGMIPPDENLPPAAITQHSRPTDLRAPAGLRETVPQPREAGSYAGYTCLWLLDAPNIRLLDYQESLTYWLKRIAAERDWDFMEVQVGEFWVNVHIEIPVKELPADMMQVLMAETNHYLLEALGQDPDAMEAVWAHGYSITAPGRLLEPAAIERFIRYYGDQMAM